MTIQEIEKLVGYSVDAALSEYRDGDYGDPDEWTGEQIADAEVDGDFGDRLRAAFRNDNADYEKVMSLLKQAIVERWHGLVHDRT